MIFIEIWNNIIEMEELFIVNGGRKIEGEIEVFGAKNSATAILAATLLIKEDCYIDNLPRIKDVLTTIDILKSLGSKVEWVGERMVRINNKDIEPEGIDQDLVTKLRSSVLLIAPLVSRFGKLKIARPGGCMIGARPLDTHLEAFRDLGIEIEESKEFLLLKKGNSIPKKNIILKELSVTATENVMAFSSLGEAEVNIKLAAIEPQIQDLASFLRKAGASVEFGFDHTIKIRGMRALKGVKHFIIYDPIEAGTFIALSLASRGVLAIKNVRPEFLEAVLRKAKEIGAEFEIKDLANGASFRNFELKVFPVKKLKAFKVQTLPYPGFPTDLQAPFGLVATQAEGLSLIQDALYEGRLKYLDELVRMGAKAIICDAHRAVISGPKKLFGQEIKSYDLRAGATLVMASLIAEGRSKISEIFQVDRGYEKLEERLQKIGADIKRVTG